MVKDKQQTH